jgi:hypothetical protein
MKIKHSTTGKTIKVPKHLETSVRQAISSGTDPMSVMAEGGVFNAPKFGVEMNVPRALYPTNNKNLVMHRNGGLVKYENGNYVDNFGFPIRPTDTVRSLNNPNLYERTALNRFDKNSVRFIPTEMNEDPNFVPFELQFPTNSNLANEVRFNPGAIEGDPNYIPEELQPYVTPRTPTNYLNDQTIVDDLKPLNFNRKQYEENKKNKEEQGEKSYAPYALATNLAQALIQYQNLNKTNAPTPFNPIGLTAGVTPNRYDLSAQRQAIDADTAAANTGIRLGGGSYSTQAGNLQRMRNLQMQKKGDSFQTEANMNTQAINEYNRTKAAAANEAAKANAAIDQANREALYNYGLWKTGAKNAVTADTAKSIVNIFNNLTAYKNEKELWKAYGNKISGKRLKQDTEKGVAGTAGANEDDQENKKYGGMIKSSPKRSLKRKAG